VNFALRIRRSAIIYAADSAVICVCPVHALKNSKILIFTAHRKACFVSAVYMAYRPSVTFGYCLKTRERREKDCLVGVGGVNHGVN